MTRSWSGRELDRVDDAEELQIAVRRADGTLRRWVTIWVVRAGDQVYVRTWHRRDTGWFGHAVASRRARIRADGLEADVVIEDVGQDPTQPHADVDSAYGAKYGRFGDATVARMVSDDAIAATLRLSPET